MYPLIVIPCRLDSKRLPGKALLIETGKSLIEHVWSQCCRVAPTVVATDSQEVFDEVESFGGKCKWTGLHETGTDRCAEIASKVRYDLIVNVQADEPEVKPESIKALINYMETHPEIPMGTLACFGIDGTELLNRNIVKVVVKWNFTAMYFSRCLIPFGGSVFLRHIGVYAYRPDFLLKLAGFPQTDMELAEGLEQLRALQMGYDIGVCVVKDECRGINTYEDYERFVNGSSRAS